LLPAADRSALRLLDRAGWPSHPPSTRALRPVLEAAAARYLLSAKTPGGRPLDPVARFHLGNGARLERLNWMADPSARGLGFMVNYVYDLARIERNHELYAERGRVVAAGPVRSLLRAPSRSRP
jgi:malonyl-CoA decarboxylase